MPIPKGVKHAGEYPIRRHVQHLGAEALPEPIDPGRSPDAAEWCLANGNPERAMLTTVQQS